MILLFNNNIINFFFLIINTVVKVVQVYIIYIYDLPVIIYINENGI